MRFLDLILIIEIKTVKEKSESSHTGYPIWMSKSDEELISISPTIQILLGNRLKKCMYRNNLEIKWFKKYLKGLTPTLSGSDIVYAVGMEIWKWNFFGAKEFFYMIFDLKNGCKNEFKDNNEKSCSWSRNRVSRKIDFKVYWRRNSHTDSVGVNIF